MNPERHYSIRDPKGWGGDPSRGAALGRRTINDGDPDGPITVRRSRLDRQGYDRNGTYFGSGDPLYWYADEGGMVEGMIRARDNNDALAVVRVKFPGFPVIGGEALKLGCFGAGEDPCPDKADAAEGSDLCDECEMTEMCSEEEGYDE